MNGPPLADRIRELTARSPYSPDKPIEKTVAEMIGVLVLEELAGGRKLQQAHEWISFTMEGDKVATVKIDLRFV